MSDKLITKPFQNLLCEVCGERVHVSKGEGFWRVECLEQPWRYHAVHTECLLPLRKGIDQKEGRE